MSEEPTTLACRSLPWEPSREAKAFDLLGTFLARRQRRDDLAAEMHKIHQDQAGPGWTATAIHSPLSVRIRGVHLTAAEATAVINRELGDVNAVLQHERDKLAGLGVAVDMSVRPLEQEASPGEPNALDLGAAIRSMGLTGDRPDSDRRGD
jgi:hypothetical protein